MFAALPETIITAIASPIARPTPSTTAAAMPLRAAGTDTLKYVSTSVAPRASDASFGTASSAVTDTFIIEGNIIIASTIIAASRLAPSGTLSSFLMPGTSTSIPTKPYTTLGIPASRLTADCMTALSFLGANFAIYTLAIKPIGTPSTIAPHVPYMLVNINGSMPNEGSVVFAVEAHTLPNRNGIRPISLIAGRPDIIR